MRWQPGVLIAVGVFPGVAWAHTGAAPTPHDLWRLWTWPPLVAVSLAVSACCYAAGWRALARRAHHNVVRGRVVLCFVIGLFAVALALISPIDAISEALFSVHMVQHLLLIVVAAPLIVLGRPEMVMLWSLPLAARRRMGRVSHRARRYWRALTRPAVAWTLHTVALWIWHLPRFYDLALEHEGLHIVEHTSFMLTALMFWSAAFDRRRLNAGSATLYLFAAVMQCTVLGALLALGRHPWYSVHQTATAAWGLTPLEDQQLAGLLMWVPAGMAYLIALLPRLASALVTRQGADVPAGVSARGTPYAARIRSMSP